MTNEVRNFSKIEKQKSIPRTLPLLDYVMKLYSLEQTHRLNGYKILAVQHLLGSTIPFFTALEKAGAKPEDIYIVGKAYSSHPLVVKRLQQKGYQVTPEAVFDFSEDRPYDSILERHIIDSTAALLEEIGGNQQGLIIDDGGKAIKLLHQNYQQEAHRFTCVEQTSRGTRTISALQLKTPVVNVARSEAKTQLESPLIAKAMVSELISSLKRWEKANVFHLSDKRVLLLGYGFIGKNVAKELSLRGFYVSVYDLDENKLRKAESEGFKPINDLGKGYKTTDVLVGSSGTPVITDEEFKKLKQGTLLVNMASTDTEFSAWNLRTKGEIVYQHVLPHDKKYLSQFIPLSWRSLYKVQLPRTYIYLANGGFPIDFSGEINPIPFEDIQLTSALLLGGAIQAIITTEPGLIDLDLEFQVNVVNEYLRLKSEKIKD